MAVSVTHTFVSPVADAGDPDIVGPNEWNDAHQVTGLGTAAEANVGDFATAAQGALADSATQPGDLSAVATSGAYSDLSGKPTLGTAAAANTGDFATAAQGGKADTALQPAAIGVAVQAYDADLTAWAGVNPSSYSTTSQIAAAYQPLDPDLTTIAGLSRARGDLIRGGASAWERYALGTTGYALKSDGTDTVWAPSREVLTANRTYYVRADGSDSNNGLANTSGGAFLTGQKAWDTVAALDLSIYSVTIKYANGTYTGGISMAAMPVGGSSITIEGDTATPANVHINRTATCFSIGAVLPCAMTIKGFKFTFAGASASAITLGASGLITTGPLELAGGSTAYAGAIVAGAGGARINVFGAIAVTGGMSCLLQAIAHGIVFVSATVTLTGTPAWSWVGVNADSFGLLNLAGAVFSGSATGGRYAAGLNGGIHTNGGGASFIPGSSAGSVGTNGWYT